MRRLLCFLIVGLFTGCAATPPAELPPGVDFSLTRVSPNKHFVLTLIPPATVPVLEIHSWQVKIATQGGQPVTKALVYMNGGMPEHAHGLPTRPAVTKEVSEGVYLIEGVKFSMTGWWEILIAAQKGEASDVTAFNYYIALPPPAKR
jgi:hypothetical protein